MGYKIITISRQCGSGGHTIGQALAEKLNIPQYDKKILEEVSRRSGLAEDVIENEGEYSTSSKIFNIAMGVYNAWDSGQRDTMPLREQINAYQTEFIREVADKGGCVIVGRCAEYILRERTDCLNVFIYGNQEERVKRVIEEHRVPDAEAEVHLIWSVFSNTEGISGYWGKYIFIDKSSMAVWSCYFLCPFCVGGEKKNYSFYEMLHEE